MIRYSDRVSSKTATHSSRAVGHPLDRYACSMLLPHHHPLIVSHDLGWRTDGPNRPHGAARRKMRRIGLELRLVSARRLFHCLGSVVRRKCRVRLDKKTVSEPSHYQTHTNHHVGPPKTLGDITYSSTSLPRVLHRATLAMN